MRSLSDVDRQINENFRARLAQVLDEEPRDKVRAALAALETERASSTKQGRRDATSRCTTCFTD